MKYKIKRKKRTIKVTYICLILLVIIVLMSTSYSLWQTNLYINGTVDINYVEPELPVELVDQGNGRFSTNTSFTIGEGILADYDIFTVSGDTNNGNTVTTNIVNAGKPSWIIAWMYPDTVTVTVTMSIQNNSGFTFTEGRLEGENNVNEEYDPNNRITPASANLSTTTVQNGESVTLTAEVTFDTKNNITVGSYVNYKISFLCDGARRYYNYRIQVSG